MQIEAALRAELGATAGELVAARVGQRVRDGLAARRQREIGVRAVVRPPHPAFDVDRLAGLVREAIVGDVPAREVVAHRLLEGGCAEKERRRADLEREDRF